MAYDIRVQKWEPDRRHGQNRVISTALLSQPADTTWREAFARRATGVPGMDAATANVRYDLGPGGDRVLITAPEGIAESLKDSFERFLMPQINRRANALANRPMAEGHTG